MVSLDEQVIGHSHTLGSLGGHPVRDAGGGGGGGVVGAHWTHCPPRYQGVPSLDLLTKVLCLVVKIGRKVTSFESRPFWDSSEKSKNKIMLTLCMLGNVVIC